MKLPVDACTGCTACQAICPVNAISMKEDDRGFLRPVVDKGKCMECKKCERVCPAGVSHSGKSVLAAFAAKVKDAAIHSASQSGGVFYALAEEILAAKGAVYGAAIDGSFETCHIRVTDPEGLKRLQGVKYVQSRMGDSFRKVGEDLKIGKPVLFSGTPCQVAGVLSYVRSARLPEERLLTCDVVCYGVPSPGVFRAWMKTLQRAKGKVLSMQFRRTDAKWGKGKEIYRMADGSVVEGEFYTGLYFCNQIHRESCVSCKYCNLSRPGDITLGDFWGIEKVLPECYDDRGVSAVLVNTEKGRTALEKAASMLILTETTAQTVAQAQPRLQGIPAKHSPHRETFWEKYRKAGMDYVAMERGFVPPSFRFRLIKRLERIKTARK
ncbi:MAG: Coenzyme F420 hydrogenase/dehydrogenase, beta subunit C-terminal domain [Oscillospiraceae bacterium]|nr:Coenzyme F420 hydrogenase/dehydrogenase, beta subunit C-terminal domain [Oscillospiraceae bacterium]